MFETALRNDHERLKRLGSPLERIDGRGMSWENFSKGCLMMLAV